MALREACSPRNMTSASGLVEVLRKKKWSGSLREPLGGVGDEAVILAVVVKPEPPWEAAVTEAEGGMGRARTMEGSSFILGGGFGKMGEGQMDARFGRK